MCRKMIKFLSFSLVLLLGFGLAGCTPQNVSDSDPHPNTIYEENILFATSENPVISPSGDYLLQIEAGYMDNVYFNQFVIYQSDKLEQVLFDSAKQYRTRDKLYFCWDEQDNVWVYSGDTGMSVWLFETNGITWREEVPSNILPPDILANAVET